MLRCIPSAPYFLRSFKIKGCWTLSKSCSCDFCSWVILCDVLYWFIFIYWTVFTPLDWNEFQSGKWSFWYILQFDLKLFYWEFCTCIHQKNWCAILFSFLSLSGFDIYSIDFIKLVIVLLPFLAYEVLRGGWY